MIDILYNLAVQYTQRHTIREERQKKL